MISKLFGLIVFVQLIISQVNCDCAPERYPQADESFLKVSVFGDPSSFFPVNAQEMNIRCQALTKEQAHLKSFYNDCLNAFTKQTVKLLLRGVKKELKKYCSPENLDLFLSAAECGTVTKAENKVCYDKFSREMRQIINAPHDDKLRHVCCTVYSFQDCINDTMSAQKKCSKKSINAYVSMVKGYTDEARQLICGGVDPGSEVCKSLQQKIKKIPVSSFKSKSPLLSYLEITKNL